MHRFAIREGWTTFWLVALLVFTATWSIQMADWADGLHILSVITLVGLVVGLILAQAQRIPSIVAHLIALSVGAVVVLYQVTGFLSDSIGGRRAKLDYLWTRWEHWYTAVSHGERADDLYLFILLMAALLWVLSYISVWFVFRSHWIWLALLLPGVILLLNMGYSQRVPHAMVVLYLFAAILLLMRFTFAERELSWKRIGIPYPEMLPWRGFWVASYLAVAVILVGWVVPVTSTSQLMVNGWERVNSPWRDLESNFNNWFSSLRGPGSIGVGGFASFGNKFELGGPLRLSDQPVLVVKGGSSGAPYVIARTYNTFNGIGWESDLDQANSNQTPGGRRSGLLEFRGGERIPVPTAAEGSRKKQDYTVQVLTPRNAVVFTSGETSDVSVPTSAQVAYHEYENQVLDVEHTADADVPPSLLPLVKILRAAEFEPYQPPTRAAPTAVASPDASQSPGSQATPDTSPATPTIASPPTVNPTRIIDGKWIGDPEIVKNIKDNLDDLSKQGISVDLEFAQTGDTAKVASFTFTGSLPVYSDIEAFYATEGIQSNQSYEVTSLQPDATPDQLRQAGTEYPVEISDRYLNVPAHTQRTQELAERITADANNPFDKASAIERYLRQNMTYDENVPNPPSGNKDLVDYFLFQLKRGYCTYYSSAMNEMLRIIGIPSREVVGFYPADYDSNVGGYLYRDRNAHAWVEVYFPGYGWVPFEPTASRTVFQYGPTPTTTTSASSAQNAGGPNLAGEDRFQDILDNEPGFGGGSAGSVQTKHVTTPLEWTVRAIVGLVLLLVAVVAFFWLRGMRGMTPTTRFFTKVQRGAGWGGLPTRESMTPYEYASTVSRHLPGARLHVGFLADLYVRERYGQHPASATELSRARSAWLRLRAMLLRYAVLQRWRGRRPASGMGFGADDD